MVDGWTLCRHCNEPIAHNSWTQERRMRHIKKHYKKEHPQKWKAIRLQNGKLITEKQLYQRRLDELTISALISLPLVVDLLLLLPYLI